MTETTDLLYAIVGIAMKVQDQLGRSHPEEVYHSMLESHLRKAGHAVLHKPKLTLRDAQGNWIKTYEPDLRVASNGASVLVELKATPTRLSSASQRQADAYLSISDEDEATLLLNFGRYPLEQLRIYRRRSRR